MAHKINGYNVRFILSHKKQPEVTTCVATSTNEYTKPRTFVAHVVRHFKDEHNVAKAKDFAFDKVKALVFGFPKK